MLKTPFRNFHTYFFSECYFEDMVEICSEWNENCWNYVVCRFKKTCFEKNAFKVLRCISEQSDALKKEVGIAKKKILYRHKTFSPLF